MQNVLLEVREKIENEQTQKSYLEMFKAENHEYEQFTRRHFFEKVFEGTLTAQEIYEEAKELSMELNAPFYNLILFSVADKKKAADSMSMTASEYIENIQQSFPMYTEYTIFRWNINTYGVLIAGEESEMDSLLDRVVSHLKRFLNEADKEFIEWYIAIGTPVNRLSFLSDCYKEVNKIFSFRFLLPNVNILTKDIISQFSSDYSQCSNYKTMDISKIDSEIIKGFLQKGEKDEVDDFVHNYLNNLAEPAKSQIFRNYLVLSVRFAVLSFVESLGKNVDEFISVNRINEIDEKQLNVRDVTAYMLNLVQAAIEIRDEESDSQGKNVLEKALKYIDDNFTSDSLSLNEVASAVDVSPNYFSGLFSAEMNKTFVEYVTEKRMDRAKKLLKTTNKHSREIGLEVGYKDSHYFSFVFKKTQGITPKEYRNS